MDIENLRNIILASGSERRKEIMNKHGIDPVIMPMDVDETLPLGISPYDAVMFLSLKKGLACESELLGEHALLPGDDTLILAADTIVYSYDITIGREVIMGKPKDDDDAWRMLSSIRGSSHEVVTGVTMISRSAGGELIYKRTFYDATKVFVNDVSDAYIMSYIRSGEPFGKAGGYAIQLGFGKFIDHIEGDRENVIGLPYTHIVQEFKIANS